MYMYVIQNMMIDIYVCVCIGVCIIKLGKDANGGDVILIMWIVFPRSSSSSSSSLLFSHSFSIIVLF